MVIAARDVLYQFLGIGAAVFACGFLMFSGWMTSG